MHVFQCLQDDWSLFCYAWRYYTVHGHIRFFVAILYLFFVPLCPRFSSLWTLALLIKLLGRWMWRMGRCASKRGGGQCASASVWVVKGKREPAVAQHPVTHSWVSKDNCRYHSVPISLMWTCGIMETALSQGWEIERTDEEINTLSLERSTGN